MYGLEATDAELIADGDADRRLLNAGPADADPWWAAREASAAPVPAGVVSVAAVVTAWPWPWPSTERLDLDLPVLFADAGRAADCGVGTPLLAWCRCWLRLLRGVGAMYSGDTGTE